MLMTKEQFDKMCMFGCVDGVLEVSETFKTAEDMLAALRREFVPANTRPCPIHGDDDGK